MERAYKGTARARRAPTSRPSPADSSTPVGSLSTRKVREVSSDILYETFEGIPTNRNVRKRLHREARLGARPVPISANIGDAVHAVTAAAALKDGWEDSTAEPSATIRTAWTASES